MVRSALTLGCLPRLPQQQSCSWIPVDTLAASILELAFPPSSGEAQKQKQRHLQLVYNLSNPRTFSWSGDFLPALAAAGLRFEAVEFGEWLAKLKSYGAAHGVEEQAIEKCPAVKLVEYYEGAYGAGGAGGDGKSGGGRGEMRFETGGAERDCGSLRGGVDVVGVGLWGGCWAVGWGGGQRARVGREGGVWDSEVGRFVAGWLRGFEDLMHGVLLI